MITTIPSFWNYSKELETLFFFFQRSEEMLSKFTVDTYHVKMHNTLTLCEEALLIYYQLDSLKIIDDYYSKYICNILDELLYSIQNDEVIKQLLGKRLSSVTTGIKTAKDNPTVMKRWIEALLDYCPSNKYIELNKQIICNSVMNNVNKHELLKAMDQYYSQIIAKGYSEEYIYRRAKDFFAYGIGKDEKIEIKDPLIIKDYLDLFDFNDNEYEFIILIDDKVINYYSELNISGFKDFTENIAYLEDDDIIKLGKNKTGQELVSRYYEKQKTNENIKIIKYTTSRIDYISALNELDSFLNFIRSFESYFKHHTYYFNMYMAILKTKKANGQTDYVRVDERDALQKRPYISQEKIDKRIKTILNSHGYFRVWSRIVAVIDIHHEAVKIDNKTAVFRDFWVALESIFLNPKSSKTKNNTISSTINIVQKTYILKRLRTVYHMIIESTTDEARHNNDVETFEKFVLFFSKYNYDSDEMKKLYGELENNPLLRFRLYELRKSLSSGKKVLSLLDEHHKIVSWQINRLYRIRNISTHLGYEFPNIESALYNLHNYLDYVVNYIICCWENGKHTKSISQLVFEIQTDNQLFRELLKCSDSLCEENYLDLLFGGDSDLIHYEFEFYD